MMRDRLLAAVRGAEQRLVALTKALVAAPSGNPPGDTTEVARVAAEILEAVPGAEVSQHVAESPIVNVVARLKGEAPGPRLVFNGHLDTYPVGDAAAWSHDPLAGEVADGKLYGRGVTDMKGGIACSLLAFELMATCREAWAGELVVTLAGDEEVMGMRGTKFLLETVPHATGDAMICGDAGSPRVIRLGEKGMLWLALVARGRAAHGAHVHLGASAIERLTEALTRLTGLRAWPVESPPDVARVVAEARAVSEPISGAGEAEVLESVTVNFGTIEGGRAANLVAEEARATADIRLPAGVSLAEIEAEVARLLDPLEGISYAAVQSCEASWSGADHPVARLALANAKAALGGQAVVNQRVGGSDARLYRDAGVPSIVVGLTPHNMGAADEYTTLEDLRAVAEIHTMTAFDFLTP
ncbi:MAG: M20/M25/M40 family metallo-hydrolase [Pseudomonadota bacterium]